ncbi:3887_t:CDS:2 [Ambispora gerdemannii]|uniref:DNA topoisomerase 2 n=1 Tax=Ambispora gerdemannii TaxID=144530 RepID=A0A9N8VKR4_9GLOM|nr:3887_t:CDS:2 [Ambispora gerdemannii]
MELKAFRFWKILKRLEKDRESVAGYCSEVKITLSLDQKHITVEDNGRGIPIAIHPDTKKSTLETIFTFLHSGGKFENKVYKTSGGLHGVGVTAVNALSANLKFQEGVLINSQITDTPKATNGITITFTPDPKIFQEFTYFKIETIQNRLKELAYLNPNVSLAFATSPEATPITYHYSSGLADKYPNLKVSVLKDDVLEGLVTILAVRMKDPQFSGQTKDRLANKSVRELVKNASYDLVRRFLQDHGNSAEAISRQIITNAQNRAKYEEYEKSLREGGRGSASPETPCISKDTANNELFIVEGESAGGSAKSARDPNNQAVLPVQGKIINVEKAERVKIFENEEIKNLINALGFNVSEATQNYYNRFRTKSETDLTPEQLQEIEIPEEFIYQDEEGKEVIIPAHTALTSEQLKVIVAKTQQSLLKKLRYGKVIIMTDADPDGKHIECLALTFFVRYFRYLIDEHRLYLAVPPFYRIKTKQEIKYLYNDQELEEYRQQVKGSYTIQRFKGLGEMNPQQLRETTMATRKRCLHELLLPNPPSIRKIIQDLMGPKSEPRKKHLESGDHKNVQLTVIDNKLDVGQALLVKFLEYAYAVVEDRALPQLYDGLKPVQRRILFTLYQLNLFPNKAHRKAAKVVGDVMGDYHPHGDASIYQAMVKMSQDFHYRYPLVDGQEPKILPANLNLLLNGSSGIAVGMSTNIPPHNLGEVIDATINLIQEPEISLEQLITYLPAPDFPTGGQILEQEKLQSIYEKGEGTIYIRAKAEITSSKLEKETKLDSSTKSKRDLIHITELPYKVNKAKLVESISQIIKDKKIDGLRSVADYSSYEEPVNIHLRFDPNYDGEVILNQLYKTTRLQNTFSVKMRALIDDQPKIFSLKEVLEGFVSQRLENIQKKSQFIYNKNQKELIGLETRRFIIDNYREIAEIAHTSSSDEEREKKLKNRFNAELKTLQEQLRSIQDKSIDSSEKPSDLEQEAINRILDTPASFRQFTPERREKLQNDINKLQQDNTEQQLVITNLEKRKERLIQELQELKNNYPQDKRRTTITSLQHSIEERQLIPHEERVALLSRFENKKESKINNYLTVHSLAAVEPTNIPSQALNKTTNLNEEYFMRTRKGELKPTLQSQEFFTNALTVKEQFTEKFLLIITHRGKIKLLGADKLQNINKSGKKLINLYQKTVEKCSLHQSQLTEHKATAHICGNEEIELIVKRRSRDGVIKNLKLPLYRQTRKKDEEGNSVYCSTHQVQLKKHKTANCCDKSQGVMAYSRCSQFKKLRNQIKECEKAKEKVEKEMREEKELMEERVLKSTLPLETKEKILKDSKIITGVNTKEITRKIANSPIDPTIGEVAIAEQSKDLKQKGEVYQKLLAEVKTQQEKIGDFKEKSKQCKDCQKYCTKHELKNQVEMAKHETCPHCHKYDKQVQQSKEKVEELREKLENLKKVKPGATKEIQKLINELAKKKEQGEKVRHEALGNRTKCPSLNELKAERKACPKCQEQEQKKYRTRVANPLQQVCLVDKEKSPEIYLLAHEDVC